MKRQLLFSAMLVALLATGMWLMASDRGIAAESNSSQLSKPVADRQ